MLTLNFAYLTDQVKLPDGNYEYQLPAKDAKDFYWRWGGINLTGEQPLILHQGETGYLCRVSGIDDLTVTVSQRAGYRHRKIVKTAQQITANDDRMPVKNNDRGLCQLVVQILEAAGRDWRFADGQLHFSRSRDASIA